MMQFPFNLALSYIEVCTSRPGRLRRSGVGVTQMVASHEISFTTLEPPKSNFLKVSIAWPVLLNGEVPLTLQASVYVISVSGNVVRGRLYGVTFMTRGKTLMTGGTIQA